MSDTAAGLAANSSKRSIALDVLVRVRRVPLDFDSAELVVRPNRSEPSANGAVASRSLFRLRRQRELHGSAMATAFK